LFASEWPSVGCSGCAAQRDLLCPAKCGWPQYMKLWWDHRTSEEGRTGNESKRRVWSPGPSHLLEQLMPSTFVSSQLESHHHRAFPVRQDVFLLSLVEQGPSSYSPISSSTEAQLEACLDLNPAPASAPAWASAADNQNDGSCCQGESLRWIGENSGCSCAHILQLGRHKVQSYNIGPWYVVAKLSCHPVCAFPRLLTVRFS